MSPPQRFEDGTTGRPLGDDEDLSPRDYDDIPEPDPGDHWADMSPEQRRRVTPRVARAVDRDGWPAERRP